MAIPITCPSCGHTGKVPDMALGRRIKCPKCATPFIVQAEAPAAPEPPPTPEPSLPPAQQQPLPSAFDFPSTELPPAASETRPDDTVSADNDDEGGDTPGYDPNALPWYYGFLETYTKVAMILAIVAVSALMLLYLGAAVLAMVASKGDSLWFSIVLLIVALIYYAFAILGILIAASLMLMFVDLAKNVRELRRLAQERK